MKTEIKKLKENIYKKVTTEVIDLTEISLEINVLKKNISFNKKRIIELKKQLELLNNPVIKEVVQTTINNINVDISVDMVNIKRLNYEYRI